MCILARSFQCGYVEHSFSGDSDCTCKRVKYLLPTPGECVVCKSRSEIIQSHIIAELDTPSKVFRDTYNFSEDANGTAPPIAETTQKLFADLERHARGDVSTKNDVAEKKDMDTEMTEATSGAENDNNAIKTTESGISLTTPNKPRSSLDRQSLGERDQNLPSPKDSENKADKRPAPEAPENGTHGAPKAAKTNSESKPTNGRRSTSAEKKKGAGESDDKENK